VIVFLNGLMRPAASFDPCITEFFSLVAKQDIQPWILTWDRYGQGLSSKQNKDHNAMDVVKTMREILEHLLPDKVDEQNLILVAK